jgi:hypothetical protein
VASFAKLSAPFKFYDSLDRPIKKYIDFYK